MTADIFTLCDNAEIYEGKMMITGTYNTVKLPSFPGQSRPCSVAIRISALAGEPLVGRLSFAIKSKATGRAIIPPVAADVPERPNIVEPGVLNFVINLHGIELPSPGLYEMALAINGQSWHSDLIAEPL